MRILLALLLSALAAQGAASNVLVTSGGTLSTVSYDLTTAATALSALYNHTADGIGTTATDRVQLSNSTAAAAGAQQYSPALRFTGAGWKTAATAASQATDWRIYLTPVQGSSAPTASLLMDYSVNGGAFATKHTFNSDGTYSATGNIQAGNGTAAVPAFRFTTGSSSGLFWNGSGWMGLCYNGAEVASVTSTGFTVQSGYVVNTPGLIIGGGTVTKVLTGTGTLDFSSTLTLSDADLTLTVTGAATGDCVFLAVPTASVVAGGHYSCWVSSANTVTVRFSNSSAGSLDPASGTFRATVVHF